MYIGVDLGTSSIKIALVDNNDNVLEFSSRSIATERPSIGHSEQDPNSWFDALLDGFDELSSKAGKDMARVKGIGLSGHMHSAILMDSTNNPIGNAILHNDGRAEKEARELNEKFPHLAEKAGVIAMPGFTGPKLLWLSRNEPEKFKSAKYILFAKDFLRLRLTGTIATDVTDAAGSWLFDQKKRNWSEECITACHSDNLLLPDVFESPNSCGILKTELSVRWKLPKGILVAAGAGDVACGGIAVGAVNENTGFISMGTAAQVFLGSKKFEPKTENLVHSFCHALPSTWFNMAALLNGTSIMDKVLSWTSEENIESLIFSAEKKFRGPGDLLALPYFSGERTPHNDSKIRGAIVGLDHSTATEDITLAFLESIAFSLADGIDILSGENAKLQNLILIGGGSKSDFFSQLIANVLDIRIQTCHSSAFAPSIGAARLARLAAKNESQEDVIVALPVSKSFTANKAMHTKYKEKLKQFRMLYEQLRS
jgi:xylulokinase